VRGNFAANVFEGSWENIVEMKRYIHFKNWNVTLTRNIASRNGKFDFEGLLIIDCHVDFNRDVYGYVELL
jgi:hypothetical protein